jgi:hypothetical protein
MAKPEGIGSCPKCNATLVGRVEGERLVLKQDNSRLRRDAHVEALLRERGEYQNREAAARELGRDEEARRFASRVKQVDAQLKAYGHEVKATSDV